MCAAASALSPTTSVEVSRSWDELEPLEGEWDTLLGRSPTNVVFLTFDFLRAWASSRTRESSPAVVVLRRQGRLAAVAPLMFSTRRVFGACLRSLEFYGCPASDYSDFLYEDALLLPELWAALEELSRSVDLLYLQQIPDSSPTCAFLQALGLSRRSGEVCLSGNLPPAGAPVSDYVKHATFRGFRAPKIIRRLEKEGELSLEACTSAEDIVGNLPALYRQHIARWHALGKKSYFTEPAFRNLFETVAAALAPSRAVVLYVLRLNGLPIASIFAFIHNRRLTAYTLAFDDSYRRFSCGLVSIVKAIESADRNSIDTIDFGRGGEQFKTLFADRTGVNYEYLATPTMKGRLVMHTYLRALDWTMARKKVKRLVAFFGYRGETVAKDD